MDAASAYFIWASLITISKSTNKPIDGVYVVAKPDDICLKCPNLVYNDDHNNGYTNEWSS